MFDSEVWTSFYGLLYFKLWLIIWSGFLVSISFFLKEIRGTLHLEIFTFIELKLFVPCLVSIAYTNPHAKKIFANKPRRETLITQTNLNF